LKKLTKRKTPVDTAPKEETAVLVALVHQKQSERKATEYLDELAFLAETLGIKTVKLFTQKMERPDIRTFIGKGKLQEVDAYLKATQTGIIIFDDDLSPSQLRNIEEELKVKVYDRSLLILDIFLKRAKTAQASTQVELARYQYLLPRLTNMWTHLERQRGGTGTRGGSGEKEIETDKRVIRDQIVLLKEKLEKIEKQSLTQRKGRTQVTRVALVGYTNVGKSTLMNLLSKSDVFAENKLFATVDATVRKITLDNIPFLLSDTVGFIRKLPTTLIESFKSTLDEVREADVLMHVVDVSHPSFEEHIEVVNKTLMEIGAAGKPMIMVFNKIDQYQNPDLFDLTEEIPQATLDELKASWIGKGDLDAVFISAVEKTNIEELRKVLMKRVKTRHMEIYPNFVPIQRENEEDEF